MLAGCAQSPSMVPGSVAGWDLPVTPDHGASALPGAVLPCGFPGHGKKGDAKGGNGGHVASCPVAVNIRIPALRNPHVPAQKLPGLHPDQLAAAYGFPSNATGMTVAIVDAYDNRQAEKDLGKYRAEFGLVACTTQNGCFRKVNQRGNADKYPHANRAWSQEISLDVEMVSAVCPRCPILLVEADTPAIDDLAASVDTAVRLGARVVSNSYYAAEWSGEAAEDVHYHHPGVAITASSGDRTFAYYPAASPYVTSVGGLTIAQTGNSWNESAWKYGGQGCSQFEPRPAFQPALCSTRSTVDVAMVADPQTGVTIFSTQSGGWVVAGGTSVGAPVIAAAYALSGHPGGPAFAYANPADFRDVGASGFDLATGLGSPIGVSGF
jgi:subtilase family serine protease